jgi:hypothetical protein
VCAGEEVKCDLWGEDLLWKGRLEEGRETILKYTKCYKTVSGKSFWKQGRMTCFFLDLPFVRLLACVVRCHAEEERYSLGLIH